MRMLSSGPEQTTICDFGNGRVPQQRWDNIWPNSKASPSIALWNRERQQSDEQADYCFGMLSCCSFNGNESVWKIISETARWLLLCQCADTLSMLMQRPSHLQQYIMSDSVWWFQNSWCTSTSQNVLSSSITGVKLYPSEFFLHTNGISRNIKLHIPISRITALTGLSSVIQ